MALLKYKSGDSIREIYTTDERAEEIKRLVRESRAADFLSLNDEGITVKARDISAIEKEPKKFSKETAYNLDREEDKEIVRAFERELEQIKSMPLEKELEYYGKPTDWVPAFGKMPTRYVPGYVTNPMMGLIHPAVVQHLIRKQATTKGKGGAWLVGPDFRYRQEFWEKMSALNDLRVRREYAENKEKESMEVYGQAKETLVNQMSIGEEDQNN